MGKLQFNSAQHKYTIDGKPLTGVTTILGVIAKPALVPWASKMACDYIRDNASKVPNSFDYQITNQVLLDAQNAHKNVLKVAGDEGSKIHDLIEDYVKTGKEVVNEKLQAFVIWWKQEGYELVESEKQVYSEKHWFAGTMDLLLKDKDGNYWIADIKTSSGVYNSYLYQMGGYEIAYTETEQNIPIKGYIIIHINKQGELNHYVLESETIREQAKQTFLSALTIYRAEQQIKLK